MDYSKTVNLPQTDFPMKANLPQREPDLLKSWEESGVYHRLRARNKGRPSFLLHDGPPYANGHIHLGTSLNKILKDFILKYKAMAGFDAPYTPGWDCHGLPIEQQLMKELKSDKHRVDLIEFRQQAGAFAQKFIDIQRGEFKRLGVLGDWEHPYLTMAPKYEGTIVRTFGRLVEGGYIYRQKKPVYWCLSCETALADAEVEYADHVSHSVYVKFKVERFPEGVRDPGGDTSVLIWTTTPWTLPANVALAFLAEAEYVNVRFTGRNGNRESLILSKRLMPVVLEKLGVEQYEIVQEFVGSQLEGIRCRNPLVDRESVGVLADFVTLDDGTGVVHIAPGHGQEDYQAGLKYNLPIISPVNDKGVFTEEAGEFAGHKVFAANQLIVDKLKADGVLLYDEKLSHSYPHCWRCKRAIIFRATEQWFLGVEAHGLRGRMLETIKGVKWIPGYGENRITGMISVRPDWCLSRQRLWGVPIPVVYCEQCNEPLLDTALIDRVARVFVEHGSTVWYRKSVEELLGPDVKPVCAKCGGTKFRKEQDIFDVWFDSGVSSEAVLSSGNYPDLSWPADLYLEGSDQHRGWFQTSLIPAVAVRGGAPYRTVLTHGFVVDGEGKKMSKSLGNTISPQEIIDKYGADILRLWVATSDYREDIRISPEIIKGLVDTYRKVRNTLRFLLGNTFDFSPAETVPYERLREIDRYALCRLQEVVREVTDAYESYEFHRAAVAINTFCTVFLSGFYLDALKDTLYCDGPGWESRRSAQSALWEMSSVLTRLLAPILSYTAEETWKEIRRKDANLPDSVFLAPYPEFNKNYIISDREREKWEALFRMREKAQLEFEKLRKEKQIGSNLEAHLELYDQDRSLEKHHIDTRKDKELLSMVAGTWDLNVEEGTPEKSGVHAHKSGFAKCERCWRHTEDVEKRSGHGENHLCGRCDKALDELGITDEKAGA